MHACQPSKRLVETTESKKKMEIFSEIFYRRPVHQLIIVNDPAAFGKLIVARLALV